MPRTAERQVPGLPPTSGGAPLAPARLHLHPHIPLLPSAVCAAQPIRHPIVLRTCTWAGVQRSPRDGTHEGRSAGGGCGQPRWLR
jgi:hypothetical protein